MATFTIDYTERAMADLLRLRKDEPKYDDK